MFYELFLKVEDKVSFEWFSHPYRVLLNIKEELTIDVLKVFGSYVSFS